MYDAYFCFKNLISSQKQINKTHTMPNVSELKNISGWVLLDSNIVHAFL